MRLLYLVPWLALAVTPALAEETLFEDTFGQLLPRSVESRGDFHVAKEIRQSGPLAPAAYAHNGEGWQAQTHFFPQDGVVCRLFPKAEWLLASPAWELDSADGNYEVTFEFSYPDATTSHLAEGETGRPPAPVAETILEVGQTQPTRGKSSIAVVVRSGPGQPSLFMVDGQPAGEFAGDSKGQPPHTATIRWKQEGGVVSDIVAELDGQKIEADGGFAFAGFKVLFGGRGRFTPPDYEPGKVNCLNVLRLAYTKD